MKNKDSQKIAQIYTRKVLVEAITPEAWIKSLAGQRQLFQLMQQPVSFSTTTQTGGQSHGQVTLKQVLDKAKTLLTAVNNSPKYKEQVLTKTANELQDYIAGLNQDSRVPQNLRLDNETTNNLMDTFANLGEVEKFVTSFSNTGTQTTTPAPKPALAVTSAQGTPKNDPYAKTPYANTPQEGNLKVRNALSGYMNRAETPDEKQKIMKWLNQPGAYQLDNEGWPKDPELQSLLTRANISTDSTRHLMTPEQRQEFDKRYKLSQEYRKLTQFSPDKNMTTDEIQKVIDSYKQPSSKLSSSVNFN